MGVRAAAALAAGLVAVACGHARVVSSDAQGGQLVLEGDGAAAGADARAQMAERCGGPDRYVVVSIDQVAKAPVGGPEAFATTWAPGTGQYVLTYRCR